MVIIYVVEREVKARSEKSKKKEKRKKKKKYENGKNWEISSKREWKEMKVDEKLTITMTIIDSLVSLRPLDISG